MIEKRIERNLEFAQTIGRLAASLFAAAGTIAAETRAGEISPELIGECRILANACQYASEGFRSFAVENATGAAPLYAPEPTRIQ